MKQSRRGVRASVSGKHSPGRAAALERESGGSDNRGSGHRADVIKVTGDRASYWGTVLDKTRGADRPPWGA